MAIGNLSRIGKKVSLTELPGKGGSMDTMDFHALANEYRFAQSLNTTTSTSVGGFGNKFNLKSAFSSLQGNKINSQTYMGGDSDYNGAYDVTEIFFDIGTSASHRLYIGHKHTLSSGNQWCSDVPMVGAQILDLDGSVRHNITFTDSTMEQNVTQYSTAPTPQTLNSASFIALNDQNNYATARFNYRQGTPSPRTGAQYGFDNSQFDDIPYPVSGGGNASPTRTISQEFSQKFVYREMSSSSTYQKIQFMRTVDTQQFPAVGSIRIAYANTTETARYSDLDEDDTILVGIY